ncbi:MAG: threonine synthase [Caenispirillum bisanense]|nr:threonine synthase [Caenispirillum bisanense]MCA1974467.1 threonine synthase [Caenispirillum sp.]
MRYVSTRGEAPALSFDDVLLTGLARDGGLYVPEHWPTFTVDEIRSLRGLSYQELAVQVMKPFVAGCLTDEELTALVGRAYATFEHAAVAPLKQLGPDQWVMELFHGPTLAFKDYALQFVGHAFEHVLKKRGSRITIVGATSGDTGSAAIEACRDRDAIDIFILHPKGRTSDVQRRQMTTVQAPNVHNIALEGTFDDCQDAVKALFADTEFRDEMALSAVNSINWARIMAQVVYYFWAGLSLGAPDRGVVFAVPTGNFGNVFAGYVARRMGLPIEKFVVGSNSNDILTRFFETGAMTMEGVVPTLSPSMDIQVSSNFERLLFDAYERDGQAVKNLMAAFRQSGTYTVAEEPMAEMLGLFEGLRLSDEETKAVIAEVRATTGELLDPHSAIAVAAARKTGLPDGVPVVALATAHPAKFPDAVEAATGHRPGLPERLADLFERAEKFDVLPNDVAVLRAHIRKTLHVS